MKMEMMRSVYYHASLYESEVAHEYAAEYSVEQLQFDNANEEHVILLNDGSFICTCLLLQNNGIVCRHYFHLMQIDSRFKYHVKLIPRRWFKEHLQDSQDLEESFGPFLCAMTQKSKISGRMKDIIAVVDLNPEMFELVKEGLDEVIVKGRGVEGMKDPVHVKAKGRPRKTWIKSSIENRPHSTKSLNASQHE
ncbi:MAG: hypothetical protein BYD32DRAFT_424540 [Podila humilis]|nr:MAG: hypothetical protein BYD32DRAFT_424540 [Podila humilis]